MKIDVQRIFYFILNFKDIQSVAETVKRLESILASKYAQLQAVGSEGLSQNQEIQNRLQNKHLNFQSEIQNRAQPIATLNQNYMETCNERLKSRSEKKNEWSEQRRSEIEMVAQATAGTFFFSNFIQISFVLFCRKQQS